MKLKKLFILCTFALFALITTGCFGDISNVTKLTFVQTPQSIYYVVGSDEAMAAQQEVLENVIVKVDENPYTLKDLKDLLGATVEGLNLTDEGTHTLVIKFEGATLTYIYKVVKDLGATLFAGGDGKTSDTAYQIATPEQFMNMFFRVYGIAAPAKLAAGVSFSPAEPSHVALDGNWKTYYQACFPFFTTGVYYKLIADLDFDGEEFVPLGALGGENYVPFTGIIDGDGHTIKNITVSPVGDASSIFAGIYGATIKNLNIDNFQCDVNSFTKYAAALSSFVFGDESLIEDVHVTNSQIFAQRAGGILSDGRTFIVKDCSVDENTIIAGPQYVGAVAAKSNTTRNFSYYLLTFAKLPVKTVSLDEVENKIFIITGFTSEAKLYSSDNDSMWDGYLYASGLAFTDYYIDGLESGSDSTDLVANVEVVSEAPENATTVYLAVLSYSSLYTDGSNRAFIFDSTVYDAWVKGKLDETNVEEAFDPANPPTQAELMNDARFDTFNAILSVGKILFDNRIFVYDADGFVNIELMTLIEASDKYRIFFKDGVVCGCN